LGRAVFFTQRQLDHRHAHAVDVSSAHFVGTEMRHVAAGEVGQGHFGDLVFLGAVFKHRELEPHFFVGARFFGLEVPFALVGAPLGAPAKADRAVGQHRFAVAVEGHGFPLWVVGLPELAVEVAGAQVAVGH